MILSEMTDEQLQLAIAEELGYKRCACGRFHLYDMPGGSSDLPDYTGDIAAAIGLLDDFDGWHIDKVIDMGLFQVSIVGKKQFIMGNAIGPKLLRAICEAWLQARRNDD